MHGVKNMCKGGEGGRNRICVNVCMCVISWGSNRIYSNVSFIIHWICVALCRLHGFQILS